jgi:hypothetical protein
MLLTNALTSGGGGGGEGVVETSFITFCQRHIFLPFSTILIRLVAPWGGGGHAAPPNFYGRAIEQKSMCHSGKTLIIVDKNE